MKRTMKASVALILSLLLAGASAQELETFLAPLSGHPGLAAATAQLRIEEAQLQSARDPFNLSLSAGYSAFQVSDDLAELPEPIRELLAPPESASQLSADLTLRPIPFGDIADLVAQSELQYELALISWRETLAGLQVNAITTAYSLELAEDSLELAREAHELAQRALRSTEIRHANGAATDRELRDAQVGAVEAGSFVATAEAGVALARQALRSLVGERQPPPRQQLLLSAPEGEAASVQRARLQAELARVGARNARRSVLPVAQAGYTRNVDEQNSLGISIESRTLQPNLNWTWQSTARAFPETMIDGSFQIGVSASISPAITAALRAAEAQEEAADQGLQAARDLAETERAALLNELAEADRQLDLADLLYRNAVLTLEETETREELGLAIPLETQQAALALLRAELELSQARQQQLERTLALYTFTAQPILEETPQ